VLHNCNVSFLTCKIRWVAVSSKESGLLLQDNTYCLSDLFISGVSQSQGPCISPSFSF